MTTRHQHLPPGVTNRLVLVRHGEPEAAARGRCYGKLDVGLSDDGRAQVHNTAAWMHGAHHLLSAVYSSPRRRASESAEIIAATYKLGVTIDNRLCEIDFGLFEGLTYEEVEQRFPVEYKMWMERPTEVLFPGGEDFKRMKRRVQRALGEMLVNHPAQTVAIVSHGGVNRIILAAALRMRSPDIFRLDQSYAAASIIDYYEQTPIVRLMNFNETENRRQKTEDRR